MVHSHESVADTRPAAESATQAAKRSARRSGQHVKVRIELLFAVFVVGRVEDYHLERVMTFSHAVPALA